MNDITTYYTCRHIFDYTQQNEKEMILNCRECSIQITTGIISVIIKVV